MAWRASILVVALLLAGSAASAEDRYEHARVVDVESGATVQRAGEPAADEATRNLPFLPGDRVWTDRFGRVEFQFADGTLVRLDSRSKLDYVAREEGSRSDRVVLRLWSGAAYVESRHVRGTPDFAIETPAGVVETRGRGLYRVDVEPDLTRVAVHDGGATLEGAERVEVRDGEQVEATRRGVDRPTRIAGADEFDRWNEQRDGRRLAADHRYPEGMPEEIVPYLYDLDSHGSWYYERDLGHVWRPVVASSWRPYSDGRWVWTAYGWTWVAAERWGWAPFHYGRWDYRPALGWYWMPSNGWAPAWVSWAFADDYVGWRPLGRHNRPVQIVYEQQPHPVKGHAVPRNDGWNYARRGQRGTAGTLAPVTGVATAMPDMRPIDSPHARPTRDLRTAVVAPSGTTPLTGSKGGAVHRKPTMADSVPEMRQPEVISVFPSARRQPVESTGGAMAPANSPRTAEPAHKGGAVPRVTPQSQPKTEAPTVYRPVGGKSERSDDGSHGGAQMRTPRPQKQPEAEAHPRPVSQWPVAGVIPVAFTTSAEEAKPSPRPVRQKETETDRDVLRRLFRPADEPRSRREDSSSDEGSRRRGNSESGASERKERPRSDDSAAPRREAPPKEQPQARRRPPKADSDQP